MTPPRYIIRMWVRKYQVHRLLKWGNRCFYCECDLVRTPNNPRQLTVDHWIPKSQGGNNKIGNLVLACAVCNRRKGILKASDYMASQTLKMRQQEIYLERIRREY